MDRRKDPERDKCARCSHQKGEHIEGLYGCTACSCNQYEHKPRKRQGKQGVKRGAQPKAPRKGTRAKK